MNCGISKQIAEHCDDKETYCPVCESTMLECTADFEFYLECDNEECGHKIYLNEVQDA